MDLDPNRILNHLEKLINRLGEKNTEYRKLGTAYAEKDRTYRIERAKQLLIHRNKGVAVSILKHTVDGEENVSRACYEMMVAQAEYNACLEAMRNIRESIGAYRSFLTWMRAEMHESGGVRV
jgi:hypothetical protein